MTEYTYGNHQTPSSRPPEPPYRSGFQGQQPQQPTPLGETSQIRYSGEPDMSGFDRPATPTVTDGYSPGSTQAMPPLDTGERAQYRETTTHVGDGDQTPTSPYDSSRPSNARHVEPPKPKKGGQAGKTFLFGFLGALAACAISFGAFTAFNDVNSTAASASVVTGSSDSTVIDAVEEGQTLAEAVAAKALPSVVAVYNYQQASTGYGLGYGYGAQQSGDLSAAGMGSGVVISEDGYILTNYHVVEDAEKITVKVGEDERDATYVGGDSSSDVAVLKIDNMDGVAAADIGNSDDLRIGEWVMTVGAPLGLEQSVATGVVSATNRSTVMSDSDSSSYYGGSAEYMYYPNMIQTDAVINPGNSGGALVDADGKLIGINTMISSYSGDYAGVGFAIPINYARGIAEDIIAGKEPTHAVLGVSISSVNANNAQRYGLSSNTGAYIASIAEGSGAANSDLQVGDIITAIDGKEITSVTDVTLDVREHQVGDTVTVTVNRGGQTQDIEVTLSSDEDINTGSGSGSQNQNQNQNGQRNGSGSGSSGGGTYGYDTEQLEELLRMLGM